MSGNPQNKNKPSHRFRLHPDQLSVKKEKKVPGRPDRDVFYIYNKIKDGIIKSSWVRMPILKTEQSDFYAFVEVAAAELYRALGPINGAPKTRLEEDDEKNPVAILSKYDPKFTPSKITEGGKSRALQAHELANYPRQLAECLVMTYLNEGLDINVGNFDIKRGVRLDFEYDFIDFTGCINNAPNTFSSFHHEFIRGTLFYIHPLDLRLFPNWHIAKPQHALEIDRSDEDSLSILQKLNADSEFTHTVHQYFLKALLFDKNIIDPIISIHALRNITEEKRKELKNSFSQHIETRFKNLKFALAQVPAFRESVINDETFNKFKENIKAEIAAYNATFKSSVIDETIIDSKLDDLRKMFTQCDRADDSVRFTQVFGYTYNKDIAFHRYAMQMLIASQDATFNTQNLLTQIQHQTVGLQSYLKRKRHLPFEIKCFMKLNEAILSSREKSNFWEQAEVLFAAENTISNDLQQKANNWYKANENIRNARNKFNKISPRLKDAKITIEPTEDEVLLNQTMMECGQPVYFPFGETYDNTEAYTKIYTVLDESITYAREIKERGDDVWATEYLEKVNALLNILNQGIEKCESPQSIAVNMIKEINKPNEYLLEHKNIFDWLIRSILNIFSPPEATLNWFSVSTPYFTTERQKKLCNVADAVCQLPAPAPAMRA
ncbi:MAG: hypothetical protein ABSF18_00865 [Gammaproteobacteria bacterium]|jgi:hypothetical protein